MDRHRAFAMTCMLSIALASCGHPEAQISRAGEVQYHDLPVLVPVLMLHPKSYERGAPAGGEIQRTAFYASHAHGLYIMQGDIILDSDANRQRYHAVTLAAIPNAAAMASGNARLSFGTSPAALLGRAFGADKAKAILENNVSAQGIGPYAVVAPSAVLNKGVYLPTLSARWPQPIQYCISDSLDSRIRDAVARAVTMWHDDTGLTFAENQPSACGGTFHASMLFFVPGNGCASYVGRLSSQVNPVYLLGNCANAGGVAHEIGHALGLFHEQDRADRDSYITINWANILPGYETQFNHDPRQPMAPFGQYDCGSLMQYPSWSFAKARDLKTIVPNAGANCTLSDQLTGPDAQDIQEVKFMYHLGGS